MDSAAWLARVRHDLVKRLVWPARDRRDVGGPVVPGELVAALIDDEGRPTTPAALWSALAAQAPERAKLTANLTAFGDAVQRAVAAAQADDLDGVLALELNFSALARSLDGGRG
jgi:hypothetical protein